MWHAQDLVHTRADSVGLLLGPQPAEVGRPSVPCRPWHPALGWGQWERLWFLLLTFTFGLTLTWLYFWWEVRNDYDEFNWYLYSRMGYWSDWSVPILVTTAAAFTYIAGLLVLALCHIAVGQQMNLHWLHKVRSTSAGAGGRESRL
ncbi:glycerophosphodiester phosphodiesterase domain-containing protein 5-like isoform X1 [Leptonychotes weddellii]|uniref:Glycerophosphodiester phosphodiesterase domain-containing protein 5-like isoform X1 n=1 Tax=Leptonychotes weddellii TaxID=9713 RepID=A0A7F8RSV1_LEPWE|nr:glycerophosphodiester phosphodiesterase domain-containing protein 5-like isoform X1 [Leptonychotes weddellii]